MPENTGSLMATIPVTSRGNYKGQRIINTLPPREKEVRGGYFVVFFEEDFLVSPSFTVLSGRSSSRSRASRGALRSLSAFLPRSFSASVREETRVWRRTEGVSFRPCS